MQQNVEPMRRQVDAWQRIELMDIAAKGVIYEAFVGTFPGLVYRRTGRTFHGGLHIFA
jgi:hypothetical protein